jgi:predicted DNA-binding antitoxin AbrB/MazE fold protein
MALQLEAVFEDGVLRPLQPLQLEEKQHVILTIADMPTVKISNSRQMEQEWLKANASFYQGEWVALNGDQLMSHGTNARMVRDESRRQGVERPLLVRIPDELDRPSAGWL